MRRLALLAVLALVAAGCSDSKPGENVISPVPGDTLVHTVAPKLPAEYAGGDPVAGKVVFETKGCKACHTLADAGATGTVGPDLDSAKPPDTLVLDRVLHGKGVMPSFKATLSTKQIADVVAYVVNATSG